MCRYVRKIQRVVKCIDRVLMVKNQLSANKTRTRRIHIVFSRTL